jgi:hypothetical protein
VTATVVVDVNRASRIGGLCSALMVVALAEVVALYFTTKIPSLAARTARARRG